jgi:hypothetical protein
MVGIHADEANLVSSCIPQRFGFEIHERAAKGPEALVETGTEVQWVIYRQRWREPAPTMLAQ